MKTLVWRGLDLPLMEVARVEVAGSELSSSGTQIGVSYELRYELERGRLHLELVGERELDVELGDCDFFDLGSSPLFNSLPVLRDELLERGPAHDYVMRWVGVPELEVTEAPQQYEPLGDGIVRFRSGSFTADIEFGADCFVVNYPGLAERVG
jgi:Putative glycolipid-binding